MLIQFTRLSSGIVGADPAKEIDICVHLTGCGCSDCYRLGFAAKFVTKYGRAGWTYQLCLQDRMIRYFINCLVSLFSSVVEYFMFLHWWWRWQVDPLRQCQNLVLVMTLFSMYTLIHRDATHTSAHRLWPFPLPDSVKNIQYTSIDNWSWIGRSSRPAPWNVANFFHRLSKIQCTQRNVLPKFCTLPDCGRERIS
jgi:hypothetical protein